MCTYLTQAGRCTAAKKSSHNYLSAIQSPKKILTPFSKPLGLFSDPGTCSSGVLSFLSAGRVASVSFEIFFFWSCSTRTKNCKQFKNAKGRYLDPARSACHLRKRWASPLRKTTLKYILHNGGCTKGNFCASCFVAWHRFIPCSFFTVLRRVDNLYPPSITVARRWLSDNAMSFWMFENALFD